MLEIVGLEAAIGEQPILRGIDLKIGPGEVHAIMGPNGSGKTTLAQVLAGRPDYQVTGGSVRFAGQDLLALNVEQRARAGLFLAFQYPVALPGVTSSYFLRTAVNAVRAHRGQGELSGKAFLELCRQRLELVQMRPELLQRAVNDGFSGGEKKRHEILQLALLEPRLALLDETDSGLDIDALQTVAQGVNALRSAERSFLVITHYQRLLDYIVPDVVHVLVGGRIVKSGDKDLALHLEEHGYGWIVADEAAATGPGASPAPATLSA